MFLELTCVLRVIIQPRFRYSRASCVRFVRLRSNEIDRGSPCHLLMPIAQIRCFLAPLQAVPIELSLFDARVGSNGDAVF